MAALTPSPASGLGVAVSCFGRISCYKQQWMGRRIGINQAYQPHPTDDE